VYEVSYPQGWAERQLADLDSVLDGASDQVGLAVEDELVLGWIAVRLYADDSIGRDLRAGG